MFSRATCKRAIRAQSGAKNKCTLENQRIVKTKLHPAAREKGATKRKIARYGHEKI
jgi:hypothetical protein